MRELDSEQLKNVSGGTLTSVIMDFFNQATTSSSKEKTNWTRPESIPETNTISGSTFGLAVIGIAAVAIYSVLSLAFSRK